MNPPQPTHDEIDPAFIKQPLSVAVICHTHWDREWYWPAGRYQVRLVEVLHDVLNQLDDGTLPCFTLDGQTALLADACQLAPSLEPRLKTAIRSGKISVGPWFTAPDEWLVCGESLLRNLLLGITETTQWTNDTINNPVNSLSLTGYLPDTFGHSRDMPTLLNHMSIQTAIAWRGFHTTNESCESPLFWWQGADDSRLLTLHLRQGYFNNILHETALSEEAQINALDDWLTGQQHDTIPTYLSVGGDHLGPPTPKALDWVKNEYWPSQKASVTWQHPAGYMNQRLSKVDQSTTELTTHTGEALDNQNAYVLHGAWSARLDLKQRNRQAEHRLIHQLEPWWALVNDGLTPVQQTAITGAWQHAWRTLLLNHPHDSICGCSVDAVHRENHTRFDRIDALCITIEDRLEAATERLLGGDGWVINTSQHPYTGVLPIMHRGNSPPINDSIVWQSESTHLINDYRTDHQQVPLSHLTEPLHHGWLWVKDLPSGAHSLNTMMNSPNGSFLTSHTPSKLTLTSTSDGWILENEHLRLTLTSTLSLTSLTNDQTTTLTLCDEADEGDSYTRSPSGERNTTQAITGWVWTLESPFIYQGYGALELNGEVITLSLTLKTDSAMTEFQAQWVNTRPQHAISVRFETPKPITKVLAESHLGTAERIVNPDHPRVPPTPLEKNKEWVPKTGPTQRWVTTNGLYIATQGLSEYETEGSSLAVTLLRCFGQISAGTLPTRTGAAGPPFETPDAQHLNQPCTARWAVGFVPPKATATNTQTLWGNAQATQYYGVAHAWSKDTTTTRDSENTLPTKDSLTKGPMGPFREPMVSWDNAMVERQCLKPHHSVPHAWVARLLNLSDNAQTANLITRTGYTTYPTTGLETLSNKTAAPTTSASFKPHQLINILLVRNSPP